MAPEKTTRHVVAISVATEQWTEFQEALARLKRHSDNLFKSRSALVVEAVIEAAKRLGDPSAP